MKEDEYKQALMQSYKDDIDEGKRKNLDMLQAMDLFKELGVNQFIATSHYIVGRVADVYILKMITIPGYFCISFTSLEVQREQAIRIPRIYQKFEEINQKIFIAKFEENCAIPIKPGLYATGRATGFYLSIKDIKAESLVLDVINRVIEKLQEENLTSNLNQDNLEFSNSIEIFFENLKK